jgi:hypothetical protein
MEPLLFHLKLSILLLLVVQVVLKLVAERVVIVVLLLAKPLVAEHLLNLKLLEHFQQITQLL